MNTSGRNTPRTSKTVTTTVVYDGNHNQLQKPSADVVAAVEQEEWTTKKKVINHKTRQTETRVARQIVMEDGRVIADSGPQVHSRTKEDVKTEEVESSNKKENGNKNKNPSIGDGYIRVPGSINVINEKTEVKKTSTSSKNENLQYHDEGLKELTGFEVHKKAICSPNELISLREDIDSGPIRGKLIHYSKSGKTINDTEETKELKKRNAMDGAESVEVTKTYNHEEIDDSELPRKALAGIPIPESYAETNRTANYYSNYEPNDEDEVRLGVNCQRKAITNTEKFHTDSMARVASDAENNNNNLVAKRWVDYHFSDANSSNDSTSISSDRSDAADGDGVIRRVRTKAGGNVINIEMENMRRGSPGSVRSVGSSPRVFDNHRYKEGTTHYRNNTSHTVLNSEEPSVLDLVSKYHHSSGSNSRNVSTPTRTQTPLQKEETRNYFFGLNENTNRHELMETNRRTRIVEGDEEEERRRGGGGRNSRASSKRGDSSDRGSSPGGRRSRTSATGGGGSFYFGAENDPSYLKTVRKEQKRERNTSGNSVIRIGINSPVDDPRPGVLYHKFRHT